MAFEPRMQLGQKLAQVQVMSPQMQQSLAFLQAPMLDLRSMINKELQENPVLEELSPDEPAPADNGDATAEANGEATVLRPCGAACCAAPRFLASPRRSSSCS